MKKQILTLLLCASVLLAGCGQSGSQGQNGDASQENTGGTESMENLSRDTVAENIIADFYEIDDVNNKEPITIADELLSSEILDLGGIAEAVEEGFLMGFSEDVTGFDSAAVFAPMISSIPFIGYVFKLGDEKKASDFVDQLNKKCDLNWNICTMADEAKAAARGDTVVFVMAPESFDE